MLPTLLPGAAPQFAATRAFIRVFAGGLLQLKFTVRKHFPFPSYPAQQYAATKAFISVFGASLAPEVKPHGIDVLVFHPSPVASRCVGVY